LRAVGSIPLKWVAAPAAGAATPLALVGPTAGAASPPQTPGRDHRLPAATTGRALSVLSYGATLGRNSDEASAAFRRAINAARSGDEILVPKGSYVFKRPNVALKSGVGCAARAGR
jgi:hypothetical protein